ncbi:MAG: aconitate hydratase, partial [Coxiellaceae bacterium]|nr:aconitate hydratase [Coxiellaceae bacterium]
VVAESFERIHRSNLIGMGVLPLEFKDGNNRQTLKLDGSEEITLTGIENNFKPSSDVTLTVKRSDGSTEEIKVKSRIDTQNELEYYRHGGILQYVLRNLLDS